MKICHLLLRRKLLDKQNHNPDLNNTIVYNNDFDLLGLGVNSTVSFGFYIIIGILVINYAGSAAFLSVLVAAILAIVSVLCYAEFGARIRDEASSYIYAYVCLGEIIAFIIGWTIILEFITGIASLCRALTCYIDFISDEQLINTFQRVLTIKIEYFSTYIDFLTLAISILLPILLLLPIVSSMIINKTLAIFNILLCVTIIITGATKANISNWHFNTNIFQEDGDTVTFEKDGLFKGILICFCAFICPEFIAMSKKGLRNINQNTLNPMIFSTIILALCMSIMCAVISLINFDALSYNDMNEQRTVSFIAYIFDHQQIINIIWAGWLVSIGGIIAICFSIYFILLLLPDFLNQMACDSLLFKWMGTNRNDSINGTLLISILTGLSGAFFSIKLLLNLLALGIILTCTIVAVSVLVLRYTDSRLQKEEFLPSEMPSSNSLSNLVISKNNVSFTELFNQIFNKNCVRSPTPVTSLLVKIDVLLFCVFSLLLNFFIVLGEKLLYEGTIWIICVASILAVLILLTLISISLQPVGNTNLTFLVPMLPYLPATFTFINIHLVLWLDYVIWIAFAIWIICGLCVYFICFKIYKRYDDNSLITLNRKILNGKMNFAYENQIHFEEVLSVHDENSITKIEFESNHKQNNKEINRESSSINVSDDEDKIEVLPEYTSNIQKIDNEIHEQETKKEYQQGRASSATHVLAMLDEILSHENSDPDDALTFNVSKVENKRKISVETESSNSVPLPTEHLALVHCEDEKQNPVDPLNEINENTEEIKSLKDQNVLDTEDVITDDKTPPEIENIESEAPPDALENESANKDVEPKVENEINCVSSTYESDNEDICSINNFPLEYAYIPKTPNVSRTESFMQPISTTNNNNNDTDFVNKLNQLLQEQLQEKPHNKGLYKPENYDEESDCDEIKIPEPNSLLALIHKEMREKHKLNSQLSNENKNELLEQNNINQENEKDQEQSTKPYDIRVKLEQIFQNMIAEQKLRSTPKPIISNPNQKLPQNNEEKQINVEKSDNLDEKQDTNKKPELDEHDDNELKNVATIKQKLNEIFSKNLPNDAPTPAIRKHLSAPSLVAMEQSFEMDIDNITVDNESLPPPRQISKTLNKEMHKTLMNNVFKSIELRRNSSSNRNEGSFLAKLQQQNEKMKRSSILSVSTK